MVKVLRLVLFGALMWCGAAHALIPSSSGYRASMSFAGIFKTATGSTPEAACNALLALHNAAQPTVYLVYKGTWGGANCAFWVYRRSDNQYSSAVDAGYAVEPGLCPANSTAVSGGCQCAAGYNESGSQCVQNQCAAQTGKTGILSWTEGYTLTPDEGDRRTVGGYNAPPANGEICQSGCAVSAQTSGAGVEYYVSQQPTAQGLYRRSADFPTVGLGTPCTASDSAANSPVAPEPLCPGTVGQVGNKTACVSTPSKPVPTAEAPPPSKPPIAGNPAAGPKPDSGAGSGSGSAGRTPDAGTGGNAGGSASAAVGGKGGGAGGTAAGTGTGTGTGTTGGNTGGLVGKGPEGTEQAACGAPGQPVCAVKVDETGMPTSGDVSKAEAASDKAKGDAEKAIADAGNITAPEWSFSFQLPTGCTSYTPPGFEEFGITLNPCQWQGTIHDLMSMIWAAVTAFCIIGMVGRTIRES